MNAPSGLERILRAIIDFLLRPAEFFASGPWSVALSITVAILAVSSILAIIGILYTHLRAAEFRREVKKREDAAAAKVREEAKVVNKKWAKVVEHVNSDNEANWRLAIMEADIMLEELLGLLGYQGQTVADKLRSVNRGDFKTLDMAWDGHKIRNTIAHEGSDFQLPQREARRVIGLFEKVFTEHGFI